MRSFFLQSSSIYSKSQSTTSDLDDPHMSLFSDGLNYQKSVKEPSDMTEIPVRAFSIDMEFFMRVNRPMSSKCSDFSFSFLPELAYLLEITQPHSVDLGDPHVFPFSNGLNFPKYAQVPYKTIDIPFHPFSICVVVYAIQSLNVFKVHLMYENYSTMFVCL